MKYTIQLVLILSLLVACSKDKESKNVGDEAPTIMTHAGPVSTDAKDETQNTDDATDQDNNQSEDQTNDDQSGNDNQTKPPIVVTPIAKETCDEFLQDKEQVIALCNEVTKSVQSEKNPYAVISAKTCLLRKGKKYILRGKLHTSHIDDGRIDLTLDLSGKARIRRGFLKFSERKITKHIHKVSLNLKDRTLNYTYRPSVIHIHKEIDTIIQCK